MAWAYYVAECKLLSIDIRARPNPFMTSYELYLCGSQSTLAPAFLIIHGLGLGSGLVNTQSALPLKLSYLVLPYLLTSY